MFVFKQSKEMKVRVSKEQEENIQTLENIKICCGYDVTIAFDIILDNEIIGFAMFEKYTKRTYFLWDYAIDIKYQNKGYGTQALIELGDMLKRKYGATNTLNTYMKKPVLSKPTLLMNQIVTKLI